MKWLRANDIAFEEKAIRETPPSTRELKAALMAKKGRLQPLFNTSGQDYRALGLKDKLPALHEAAALKLLTENGNLVKRPFVIDEEKGIHLIGFKEEEWKAALTP